MSFKFNLKRKINLTIFILKFILFVLAILCALAFKNLGILYTSILGGTVIISIILLHKLSKMFEKLIDTHVNNVLTNNSLISSNILASVLSQDTFVENNKDTINDITNKIDKLKIEAYTTKDIIQNIIEKSQKTLMYAAKEENLSSDNTEKMYLIKQKIQIIAELILELTEQSQHIANNINTIEDIAEQTNMLALNAAVEAARAGEHGKGFAIVASEIRKLADENKQATSKIVDLIREIQNIANSTVIVTEESSKEIEDGVNITTQLKDNIEATKMSTNQTIDDIYKILNAITSQFDTTEYLSQTTMLLNKEIKDVSIELKDKIKTIKSVLDTTTKSKDEISDN